MKRISLLASILVVLTLIISQNILANSVYKPKTKHSKTSTVKLMLDAFTDLSKYGHNPCKNQSESNNDNRKTMPCQSNIESMLKDYQTRYRLLVIGKVNQKVFKSINTPRCGVKNGPLFYTVGNRW